MLVKCVPVFFIWKKIFDIFFMKVLELYIDGACQGNPGEAGVGVVVIQHNRVIKKFSQAIGEATNNIAEYMALIFGLQEALMLRADKVKVNTDSELLYYQIKGEYKIKNPHLRFLHSQAQRLLKGFKSADIHQIPREKNRQADALAAQAIETPHPKMTAVMLQKQDSKQESLFSDF